jgi:hypothetical protein
MCFDDSCFTTAIPSYDLQRHQAGQEREPRLGSHWQHRYRGLSTFLSSKITAACFGMKLSEDVELEHDGDDGDDNVHHHEDDAVDSGETPAINPDRR